MNLKSLNRNILTCTLCSTLFLTACASNRVGDSTRDFFTKYESGHEWITILEDDVVAFGKPSIALPHEPADSIVIAGKQYSYVITQGGTELIQLLSQLDPKHIQIDRDLNFNAPEQNSPHFYGNFRFSYTPPNGKLNEKETKLFKKYGVQPCSCIEKIRPATFDLKLRGKVYPVAKNIDTLTPLSKPYHVKIQYLYYKSETVKRSKKEILQQLPILPLAIAFDVVMLPFQAIGLTNEVWK
ncbi:MULTISPECIES: hypothetical protein [Acinetobacter]|uniref:hypothetical protein n=1 Tax=Acinetobacter TaxID=469 RepID=UPI000F7495ED|nr:hypothetical protein [Acinetobacter haemolyticus]RSN73888.1 hypothetical protein EA769_14245 [Acinetobacter haemolyticus]